jgi:hypothetical protein
MNWPLAVKSEGKVYTHYPVPAEKRGERDNVTTSGVDMFLYLHASRPWISATDGSPGCYSGSMRLYNKKDLI